MDKHIKIATVFIIILFIISLSTNYIGTTDVHEYAGSAKFFAGMYNAKIRASHSVFYGFTLAPLVYLFQTLFVMKVVNLFVLLSIIISVYYISNKDKKALYLILLSPLIWYMGPWINPIQLATLLFLWGYFFITRFEKTENIYFLIFSGLFIGLSAAFWNSVIYFIVFLLIAFFYDKKVSSLIIFLIFIFIGLFPLFLLEHVLFGFFMFSIAKTFTSNVLAIISDGIYSGGDLYRPEYVNYILFILMIPIFSLVLFSKENFTKYKKPIIFLLLSVLFMLANPQIRYILFLYPIFVFYLSKTLTNKQFKLQLIIFFILSLLIVFPYIIQIKYSTNSYDIRSMTESFGKWEFNPTTEESLISNDLKQITLEYPDELFIVGPTKDHYAILALAYWGDNVKEFVSIEDYNLFLNNNSIIFKKRFETKSVIQNRRQIWIEGGIGKINNDATDYDSINYALSFEKDLELEGFELVEEYSILYLFKKQ